MLLVFTTVWLSKCKIRFLSDEAVKYDVINKQKNSRSGRVLRMPMKCQQHSL